MTRFEWRMLSVLARALEPAERDAVLGDVAESSQSAGAAVCDLAGLIARRQLSLWAAWRPWMALLGIAGLAGLALSRMAFGLTGAVIPQFMAYGKYGVHFETGLTVAEDIEFMASMAVALLLWSWIAGFVLGSLSGRSLWLTGTVFYLVVLDAARARLYLAGKIILPGWVLVLAATLPGPVTLLCTLAALWGAIRGARGQVLSMRWTHLLAAASALLAVLTAWMSGWYDTAHTLWSGGVWQADAWYLRLLPFALATWPAAWLLHKRRRTT